jgi:fructokinase
VGELSVPEPHFSRPVIAIGECLIDLIAPKGHDLTFATELRIREGGAPANVAVGLARLGVPAALRAVVGDDPFGERLRERLARERVDVAGVRVAPGEPTTIALAWSDVHGDGHFRIHRHADALLSPYDVAAEAIARAEAIVVGSVAMSAESSRAAVLSAIRDATDARVPVVADLNIRPGLVPVDELRFDAAALLSAATVIKLSLDDAHALWGSATFDEAARELARYGALTTVITDGGRGAALLVNGQLTAAEAFAVDAIEPTGAGDAFTAALISRMVARGWTAADEGDLRFAMAAGAFATTRPGAMDGLPTREQVEAFLTERVIQ